jgi:hypothetical protein
VLDKDRVNLNNILISSNQIVNKYIKKYLL